MNVKALNELMDTMPLRGFPASELAVMRDGELVYHRCAGYSDSQQTKKTTENDLYWIYSATKVITCIAAMRLVEEGRLSLNDPVSKYLPDYADIKVRDADGTIRPATKEMTILHLFTMAGGLTYNMRTAAIEAAASPEVDTVTLSNLFILEPLAFEPGEHYLYSLCHDVLAAVCEVIVGMPFSKYLDSLIFSPLGLKDIGFRPTPEQYSRISAMYNYDTGIAKANETSRDNLMSMLVNYESGGGGLFSSVSDYVKIINVIAMGGATPDGYRILKPETIEMMKKNYLTDVQRTDFVQQANYGYGWGLCGRVHMNPYASLSLSPIGEFGWDGAAGAFTMIDTDNRIAAFFATHVMHARYIYAIIHPRIRNLIYED